jgi:hypothetical protein
MASPNLGMSSESIMSQPAARTRTRNDRRPDRAANGIETERGGHFSASFKARTLRSRRFEASTRSASKAELRFACFEDDRE